MHRFVGKEVVIASQGMHSSRIGMQIFRQGGNVVDVAAAMSFALAVERPQSTGIGGGGFMLIYIARTRQIYALDFRERAPQLASRNMFLDRNLKVIPRKSTEGGAAVAVPGLVAGVLAAHERFGRLARARLLQPAIDLAASGFAVYDHLARALKAKQKLLARHEATAKVFLRPDGKPYLKGDILKQCDLAATLRRIARYGRDGFYRGVVGKKLVYLLAQYGGLIRQPDLDSYRVVWRKPVRGFFKGYNIFAMPPPSSGGVHIVQMLNVLERFLLPATDFHSAPIINVLAQSMQKAYADRALYLGDSDFVEVPITRLTSKKYAIQIATRIDRQRARPSNEVQRKEKLSSDSTTHFSIMDHAGNIVTSTQTINGWFGSGLVVPDTGVVLNNEMDDFSVKVGVANMFGALGNTKNAVQPGKRPLSSMSPTIVMRDDKPLLALGSPAGTRIITCVLQTILNFTNYGMDLYRAVALPRFHHQWQPDVLRVDDGFAASTLKKLRDMGYKIIEKDLGCSVQAVARRRDNTLIAVADPRGYGLALGK